MVADGPYWAQSATEVAAGLGSSPAGLSAEAAAAMRVALGPNRLPAGMAHTRLRVLAAQLRNPLLLLLVFAATASVASGEWVDAAIVLTIVVATVGIGYSREASAHDAAAKLQAQVHTRTRVLRGDHADTIPVEDVVPGDVVVLSAGALVPGDGLVIEATDFFVGEAALTGESFPVEKRPGTVPAASAIRDRTNCVFLGTNVRSGSAHCLIVRTGRATEFGAVARRLSEHPPETDFDRGIRRFGYWLTMAMLVLVVVVFAAHVFQGRPPVETLLFSVALAVGLSPELLPAILSLNLARGAQMLARRGVVVRHLNAIENLGSMDVLCTDKTGTLTEGVVQLDGAFGADGTASAAVLELAALNAALETGVSNPLDEAILAAHPSDGSGARKVGEIPFDFVRKRVSIAVESHTGRRLITKGALTPTLDACTTIGDASRPLDDPARAAVLARYEAWAREGTRVLAVATRGLDAGEPVDRGAERDLTLEGFLTFLDRPKEGVERTIASLAALGVAIKVISGDSALVVQHVARLVGLGASAPVTGAALRAMSDDALGHAVTHNRLFAEIDPNQKERIILALKRRGHSVGFLGDGVNDAPAMHAADTSISVETAVDVAREAADFVLLEHSLDVIRAGIEEGRRTFANTMKYILTTTSANLGNMLSMAVASLFLPFLPLLAGQILLNNFLSDIPAIGLADDRVDPELVAQPERWDIGAIGRFMVEFGALSSAFDALTFLLLLWAFHATPELFRTAWFVESLLTELVIALVVRTRRPFYRSRPGRVLLVATVALIAVAFAIPYVPGAELLGFVPLPATLALAIAGVTTAYVIATELAKRWFFRVATRPIPATATV